MPSPHDDENEATPAEQALQAYERPDAVSPEAARRGAFRLRHNRAGSRAVSQAVGGAPLREGSHLDDINKDRVAAFGPAILAIRWGTTTVSLALSIPGFLTSAWRVVAVCGALVGYTIFRTVHPIRYTGEMRGFFLLLGEVGLHVAAVVITGKWDLSLIHI